MAAINFDDVAVANIMEQPNDGLADIVHGEEMEIVIDSKPDITVPPAQDSPEHIMEILNDDCIEAIFLRLKNINDFLSAAETCVQFQKIAKERFPPNFKTLIIGNDSSLDNQLSPQRALFFLEIFSKMLGKIEWLEYYNKSQDEEVFEAIVDKCAKTLKSLKIVRHNVDFSSKAPFEKLEELEAVGDIGLDHFESYSKLKRLKLYQIHNNKIDWLAQKFPEMKDVTIESVHTLTDDIAIAFLEKNQQLQRLCLAGCPITKPKSVFKLVGKCTGVVHLKLMLDVLESGTIMIGGVIEGAIYLSDLRQLKSLKIANARERELGMLFDSFAKNNVPLEHLELDVFKHSMLVQHLLKLKFLKSLFLHGPYGAGMLPKLVKKIPMLQSIRAIGAFQVTLDDVQQILKLCQHLKQISLTSMNVDIDSDQFNSILILARDHVRVEIETWKEVTVPCEILEANREWFDLKRHPAGSEIQIPQLPSADKNKY